MHDLPIAGRAITCVWPLSLLFVCIVFHSAQLLTNLISLIFAPALVISSSFLFHCCHFIYHPTMPCSHCPCALTPTPVCLWICCCSLCWSSCYCWSFLQCWWHLSFVHNDKQYQWYWFSNLFLLVVVKIALVEEMWLEMINVVYVLVTNFVAKMCWPKESISFLSLSINSFVLPRTVSQQCTKIQNIN